MMASVSQCPVPVPQARLYQHCHSVMGCRYVTIISDAMRNLFSSILEQMTKHPQPGNTLTRFRSMYKVSWSYPLNLNGRDLFLIITWTDDVSNQACIRLDAMQILSSILPSSPALSEAKLLWQSWCTNLNNVRHISDLHISQWSQWTGVEIILMSTLFYLNMTVI